MTSSYFQNVLLLSIILLASTQTITANTITAIGTVIDPEKCYSNLSSASSNNRLTSTGYIQYLKIFSLNTPKAGYFQNIQSFTELPIEAVWTFHSLKKEDDTPGQEAFIDVSGSADGEVATDEQEEQLFDVCSEIALMIDECCPSVPTTSTTTTTTVEPAVTTTPTDKNEDTTTTTTAPPSSLDISYSFVMGLSDNKTNEEILEGSESDVLEEAFDDIMLEVLDNFMDDLRRGRERRLGGGSGMRRKLDLVNDGTELAAVNYAVCPNDAPENTFCHTATISTSISGSDFDQITEQQVTDALDNSISNNGLTNRLPTTTPIIYAAPLSDGDSGGNEGGGNGNTIRNNNTGISIGGVVGIVLGIMLLCCCGAGGFIYTRRNKDVKAKEQEEAPPQEEDDSVEEYRYSTRPTEGRVRPSRTSGDNYGGNILAKSKLEFGQQRYDSYFDEEEKVEEGSETSPMSDDDSDNMIVKVAAVGVAAKRQQSMSSHSTNSHSVKSQESQESAPLQDPRDPYATAAAAGKSITTAESSSAAGSSGWSTTSGLSSFHTTSVEDASLDYQNKLQQQPNTLAAMAAASGEAEDLEEEENPQRPVQVAPMVVRSNSGRSMDGTSTIASEPFSDFSNPLSDNKMTGRRTSVTSQQDTRSELNSAIEAADWAAVGATAALLATASETTSFKSSGSALTKSTVNSKTSKLSSIDAARTAEIDQLVDAGDWEGVVLAAAKFEAIDRDNDTSGSRSITGSDIYTNPSGITPGPSSVATSSAYSTGFSTNASDTTGMVQKRAEIRMEVEALVRRVVPDEIDNVDEMMDQFKGREEELLDTLRTMQERSIAQRARAAVNKSTTRPGEDEGGEGESMPSVHTASGVQQAAKSAFAPPEPVSGALHASFEKNSYDSDDSEAEFAINPIKQDFSYGGEYRRPTALAPDASTQGEESKENTNSKSTSHKYSSGTTPSSMTTGPRTALELAIEAGDWEAVGEAAAMMSDASVTTMSTNEIRDMAGGSDNSSSYGSKKKNRKEVNADRAAQLDNLIDKGDWSGVVEAAGHYSVSDSRGLMSEKGSSSHFNLSTSGFTDISENISTS